jgi:hypothetical protein
LMPLLRFEAYHVRDQSAAQCYYWGPHLEPLPERVITSPVIAKEQAALQRAYLPTSAAPPHSLPNKIDAPSHAHHGG